MARRGNRPDAPAALAVEVPTEVQEDIVSSQPEVVEASTEQPAEATEVKVEAPAEIDLTEFKVAVEAAVEERDKETGDLAVVLYGPVTKAYQGLEGGIKAKNAGKHYLNESMKNSMNELDMPKARAYMLLADSLATAGAATKEKVPSDPTGAFVQRVVGLRLAQALAAAHIPEGVKDDWTTQANELYAKSNDEATALWDFLHNDAEDKGDEPEASAVVKAAVKLASGKAAKIGGVAKAAGGTSDGVRRDIGKHITEAFASEEVGKFLTIAQIRAFVSTEYGENPPSAGAISARLFPSSGKCSLKDVRPETNESNHKGAVKLS